MYRLKTERLSEGNVHSCTRKQVSNYVSKSELSEELFPNIAPGSQLNALRHFINRTKRLREELEETSYNPKCRVLTPFQVSIIKKHMFGPPPPYSAQ